MEGAGGAGEVGAGARGVEAAAGEWRRWRRGVGLEEGREEVVGVGPIWSGPTGFLGLGPMPRGASA